MSMGSRLKAARVNKGYPLRKAGLMSGVGFSTISKAERDVGEIGSQHLEKLAKCYDVSLDSLMLDNAPSLRADAATVRRAVLVADLKAMVAALETGTDNECDAATVLSTLITGIIVGKVGELASHSVDLAMMWLGESWRRHEMDAAGERDGGGA